MIHFLSSRIAEPLFVLATLTFSGCWTPELESAHAPPLLEPLEQLSLIRKSETFSVSGIASTSNCELLLAGSRWGSLARINANGREEAGGWRVPGANRLTRLEDAGDGTFIVWSPDPGFLGILDGDAMNVQRIPVPEHQWGGRQVGPVVALSPKQFVMAPIGGSPARRQPDPWVTTALLQIIDRHQGLVGVIDTVTWRRGTYLSWRLSRVGLGNVADTIVALDLSSATLTGYGVMVPKGTAQTLWTVRLPQYFVSPVPREEVWTPDWIQLGGEVRLFLDVPQVSAVAFGKDGKVYAVRNYWAEWRGERNRYTHTQGSWRVVRRGLEIYDPHGKLLAAVALPGQDPAWLDNGWLRVDGHGRVFLPDGSGSVIIAQDPTARRDQCPRMPAIVELTAVDAPAT